MLVGPIKIWLYFYIYQIIIWLWLFQTQKQSRKQMKMCRLPIQTWMVYSSSMYPYVTMSHYLSVKSQILRKYINSLLISIDFTMLIFFYS